MRRRPCETRLSSPHDATATDVLMEFDVSLLGPVGIVLLENLGELEADGSVVVLDEVVGRGSVAGQRPPRRTRRDGPDETCDPGVVIGPSAGSAGIHSGSQFRSEVASGAFLERRSWSLVRGLSLGAYSRGLPPRGQSGRSKVGRPVRGG